MVRIIHLQLQNEVSDLRIVLFDGECHFCDASVQFIIKRDPTAQFAFASLQSDKGKELLSRYNVPDIDSFVLIEEGRSFVKSTAALRIAKRLNGLWPITYCFIIVPATVRNIFYEFIAKNRYKWFGKKDVCELPSPDIRKRFL